jgi:signal transduction histidine kinase
MRRGAPIGQEARRSESGWDSVVSGDVTASSPGKGSGAYLGWAAVSLVDRRGEILGRWIEATGSGQESGGRWAHALTDAVPQLFDALVELLERFAHASPRRGPDEIQALVEAAESHTLARSAQDATVADVFGELRLLHQEIRRALRKGMSGGAPGANLADVEAVINDAFGAAQAAAASAYAQEREAIGSELLAAAVHEARQALTTVKGNIQYATRSLVGPAPTDWPGGLGDDRRAEGVQRAREVLSRADVTTTQLTSLLTSLVEASQLTRGRYPIQPRRADLVAVVQAAIAGLDPEATKRILLDLPPALDAVGRWDAASLERVVTTLLLNALAYSPVEAPVTIRVWEGGAPGREGMVGAGPSRRDVSHGRDEVHFTVTDQGLSRDELIQLFQRRRQTRSALEHKIPGLGLELYLARAIVEAHGGAIRAESAGPGYGINVHVRLPRFALPVVAAPEQAAKSRDRSSQE